MRIRFGLLVLAFVATPAPAIRADEQRSDKRMRFLERFTGACLLFVLIAVVLGLVSILPADAGIQDYTVGQNGVAWSGNSTFDRVYENINGSIELDFANTHNDQINLYYSWDAGNSVYNGQWAGQSFLAGETGYFKTLNTTINKLGAPAHDLILKLYPGNASGYITGSMIANQSFSPASVSTTQKTYKLFNYSKPFWLVAGQYYVVRAESAAPASTDAYEWWVQSTDTGYASGTIGYSSNQGATYNILAYDNSFAIKIGEHYTEGNLTVWYDAGDVNQTNRIVTNASSVQNYTVSAYNNDTSALLGSWTGQTGNTSNSLSTMASDTKDNTTLYGTSIQSPQIYKITYYISERTIPPNITSWSNSNTTNSTLAFAVQPNTNVTFNITANQPLNTCTWTGATAINCTTDSYAYKNFTSSGTVSFQGSNANGSTQTITWTVTVLGAGYTVSGYVTNILTAPVINARVDLNDTFALTDSNGYYTLTDIDDGSYSVLARGIGYRNNTNTSNITGDTVINFTLQERRTPTTVPGFEITITVIVLFTIVLYRKQRKR